MDWELSLDLEIYPCDCKKMCIKMEIEIWKSSYPLDRLTVRAIPTQVVLSSFCLVQAVFVKVRISSKLDQVFQNRVKGF